MEKIYPSFSEYPVAKKNVFVISCMDLRLTDDLVKFLNFDNLTNRYDHYISAGVSLCHCTHLSDYFVKPHPDYYKCLEAWAQTALSHLELAIKLHHVEDIYLFEHMDCGAYKYFIDEKDPSAMIKIQEKFIKEFADFLRKKYLLNVHCFFMNLRGDVKHIR